MCSILETEQGTCSDLRIRQRSPTTIEPVTTTEHEEPETGPVNQPVIPTDFEIRRIVLDPYRPKLKNVPGVYCFKNTLNGKQYIGSADDLYKRLKEHLGYVGSDFENNPNMKSNIRLQRAIKKYGLESFHIHIYFYHTSDRSDYSVTNLEDLYLALYPLHTLYNFKPQATSMTNYKHTPEAKQKMRDRFAQKENHPMFGKKHTQEAKKLMSKPGPLNPMYGRKHSESTKLLLSEQKSKNTVGLFDKDHKLVKSFQNNVQVAKFLDINKTTVGRYIKSGKMWANEYYIKIIKPE